MRGGLARPPRALAIVVTILAAACGGAGTATVRYSPGPPAPAQMFSFDQEPVGHVPAGAAAFSGSWQVRSEGGAPSPPNALCQTGTAEFPAIQLGDGVFTDVSVSVRLKPISGMQDQAGGVILRVQDARNYYILRANALEGNVNLYRYVDGQRSDIKDGSAEVSAGMWHELRAVARGKHLQGFFDGRLVVETDDDTFMAGKVGLWTKSDSVLVSLAVLMALRGAMSATPDAGSPVRPPRPPAYMATGNTLLRRFRVPDRHEQLGDAVEHPVEADERARFTDSPALRRIGR